jgi:GT2 family glycosyltransferase
VAAEPPDAITGAGGRHGAAEIAIVVVNWQREELTIACAGRLIGWQRLKPRLLVVDNGSGPQTVARLRRALPTATVLASPGNIGFGGANNLALDRIRCDLMLLLNNDATIEEASVEQLVEFLLLEPSAALAGPVLEATRPPHPVLAAGGRDILRFGRTHCDARERGLELAAGRPFAVDYVPGTVALVRTDWMRRLGGFDESFFFSGEMADLSRRAAELGGGSFIVPTARARHDLAAASGLRGSLYTYYSLRNRFLYARRHAPAPRSALARWAVRGSLACLASLLRGRHMRARCQALAVADGLVGRFGPAGSRVPR